LGSFKDDEVRFEEIYEYAYEADEIFYERLDQCKGQNDEEIKEFLK
jgi:hypothetical protein